MLVSVGIRKGINKVKCDDSAIVGNELIVSDYYEQEKYVPFFGIADGVGGNAGGEKASRFVLSRISGIDFSVPVEEVQQLVHDCNSQLMQYAFRLPGEEQMATTLTAIHIQEKRCLLLHVGNTRLYSAQGRYLKQITEDHTTYQLLVNRNDVEAARNCNKDEIYACFGGGNMELLSAIEVREIFTNGIPKLLLLTSDGVHSFIDIDEMENIIFSGQPQKEIVNNILGKAIENGSKDDLSVMMIRL